jgi:hypothetical protein
MHSDVWLVEHWPHAPEVSQAGLIALGHALDALEPRSPLQPAQVPAATLQIGVVPVHSDGSEAEHWPQPPVGSQAGLVALAHALEAPDPLSPLQLAHVPEARSQTGVVPVHSAESTDEH